MNRIVRYLMLVGAWTACIVGCIGVFVPVLPTTPLLLLATFLFAKSSPRCHAWIVSTRVYRTYVAAFAGTKARILAVSFYASRFERLAAYHSARRRASWPLRDVVHARGAMGGLSAWFVQKPLV